MPPDDDSWVTTSALLDRLLDFEDSVWSRFASRFRAPIVQYARGRGLDASSAEEVAQETLTAFLGALRDGRYERGNGKLRSFLFGIASHKVVDAFRGSARRLESSSPETGFLEGQALDEPSRAEWEAIWERSILEECLRQVQGEVTPSTWRAFELTALEEREPAEVAKELDMTRNAVFVARHRVTKRLRLMQAELEDDAPE